VYHQSFPFVFYFLFFIIFGYIVFILIFFERNRIESVVDKVDVIINATFQPGNINMDENALNAITTAVKNTGGDKKKVLHKHFLLDCELIN
jgi:hypothetical protein